jgi:hypothetical protein
MSYFVVERESADGTLRMLLPAVFEDRAAALDGLSRAVASGEVTIEGEVFVVDLDGAIPVLIVPAPGPVTEVEPVADRADDESLTVSESTLGEALEVRAADAVDLAAPTDVSVLGERVESIESEDEAEAPSEESGELAAALLRAATSLESEGIVAPPSIDAAGEEQSEEEPAAVAAEDTTGDMEDASADVEEEPSSEVVVPTAEARGWPWTNIDAYEGASAPADEEAPSTPLEDVGSLIESLAGGSDAEEIGQAEEASAQHEEVPSADVIGREDDASSLIVTSAIDDGEAYLPRPVILGDYEDTPLVVAEPMSVGVEALEADSPESATAPIAVESEAAGATDETAGAEETPFVVEEIEEAISPQVETGVPAVDVLGFEATGELDLGSYTCDDCIYVNTCPKVGQSTPLECGSFQWRAQ